MASFDEAIGGVLIHEGGLVNDPADPGGLTKFGISKRQYPDLDIANLTMDQAKKIYHDDYWNPFHFEALPSQAIANKVFDMAVNIGPVMAIRILQQAVGHFIMGPLVADGKIGPATCNAVEQLAVEKLMPELRVRYAKYHADLCIENPARKSFLLGWLRRDLA